MKYESQSAAFTAAVLAFFTAWGTAGCLISAFDLRLFHPDWVVPVCGGISVLSAALLSFRQGGRILLCLTALAAGYIWQDGAAAEQLLQLICQLSVIYDRAYGWGVLPLAAHHPNAGFADWPVALVCAAAALTTARCVVRQTSVWLPVLATVLPLTSCVVVTDTVPAEHWLLMVMAALILLILPGSVRQENRFQSIRLTAAAALPVILSLTGLFWLTPQDSYVNRSALLRENLLLAAEHIPEFLDTGMPQMASGLQVQPPKTVNLASLGPRIPFTYPVMEVTAEQSGILYLRAQDYDCYDGLGWTVSSDRRESFGGSSGQTETIRIQTRSPKTIRYLPYHPSAEEILFQGAAENPERTQDYQIVRSLLPESWRQTAYGDLRDVPQQWQPYLSLPETTRQGVSVYLEQLYRDNASNTEKADIIAALVTNTARYDLDAPKMPASEPDFVLWFLREADTGYCVHFATAAVVLLRAAGIPARYVTGYMLETSAGESVTVTEENAHAWAEYYEPNLDLWLPLEATPTQDPFPETTPPSSPPETAPAPPETGAPAGDNTLPPDPSHPETAPETSAAAPGSRTAGIPLLKLLLLPALIPVLFLQRSLRLALRRKRQRTGEPNKQALLRWQEAVRLSRLLKESPTEELIVLAQKAKFSQYELSPEELQHFDSFNRSCLRRLKKKPWYLRLVHQFIYAVY